MCDNCGCDDSAKTTYHIPGQDHNHDTPHNHDHHHHYGHHHSHTHDHETHEHTHEHNYTHSHQHQSHHHNHQHDQEHSAHNHDHAHTHSRELNIQHDVMHKNNFIAERNRGYFEAKNMFVLNVLSSPGSGKTSLLERTIKEAGELFDIYVIEGDQQTMNDANRIAALNIPVIQINTGNGCHLDADMVNNAVKKINPAEGSLLFIENVGNLVCPSLFDLGETKRVVVISVTEGDDKPAKYPTMFHSADICIINKTDLLPYVEFDVEKAKKYALQLNRNIQFFELSVKTGEGIDAWYNWLKQNLIH